MPVQIDEVQAELVAASKSENASPKPASKSELDFKRMLDRMQQRAMRLRAD